MTKPVNGAAHRVRLARVVDGADGLALVEQLALGRERCTAARLERARRGSRDHPLGHARGPRPTAIVSASCGLQNTSSWNITTDLRAAVAQS